MMSTHCVEKCPTNSYLAFMSAPFPEQPSWACKVCPEGQHQPLMGQKVCVKASGVLPDTSVIEPEKQLNCSAGGYFDYLVGKCLACAIGSFQPAPGALSCRVCDGGQYQPTKGQASCLSVPTPPPPTPYTGNFGGASGSATDASSCLPGQFWKDNRECSFCPAGVPNKTRKTHPTIDSRHCRLIPLDSCHCRLITL
jgi:hypothetical protein